MGIDDFAVRDHRGECHRGDQVWLCLGASLSGFAAELFELEPLRRVRLMMAETEPLGRDLTTSVANADSFRYYPAFRNDATALLDEQDPYESNFAIQLLCQQRLHGGLTIGDTHEVDEPGLFETRDRPMDVILAAARGLIATTCPQSSVVGAASITRSSRRATTTTVVNLLEGSRRSPAPAAGA